MLQTLQYCMFCIRYINILIVSYIKHSADAAECILW